MGPKVTLMDDSAVLLEGSTVRGRESRNAGPDRCSANSRASRSWLLRVRRSEFRFLARQKDKGPLPPRSRKKWKNWFRLRHKKNPMDSYFRARFWPYLIL